MQGCKDGRVQGWQSARMQGCKSARMAEAPSSRRSALRSKTHEQPTAAHALGALTDFELVLEEDARGQGRRLPIGLRVGACASVKERAAS